MKRLVAVDTMTVIWALRDAGPSVAKRDRSKQTQAIELIDWLENNETEIIVPAVVIAEVLTPLDAQQERRFLQINASRFRPAPFDLHAASVAARLYRENQDLKTHYRAAEGPTRFFRADSLIVASAKVAGATDFYSDDNLCRQFAMRAGMQGLRLDADPDRPLFNQD